MNTLIFLEECASTNDEIERYFTLKKSDYFALYTFTQTKGKGQYGNRWNFSANQNLAFSFAIPADSVALPQEMFNFHTAIIVAEFLDRLTKTPVDI